MITRRELIWILVLSAAVVLSALAVSYAKYSSRHLFMYQGELRRELDQLEIDWGRLQLEQSTWATPSRIESEAQTAGLRTVEAAEVKLLRSSQ